MPKDIRPQAMALALPLIKHWEGFRENAYLCPAGVWTIGYGSTYVDGKKVKQGDKITKEKAQSAVITTTAYMMDEVLRNIRYHSMSPNHLAAFTSFAYNVGMGAFKTSTLLKLYNKGDLAGASQQFKRWNKATVKGKLVELPGLTARRNQERDLFIGAFLGLGKTSPSSSPSAPPKPTKAPQIAVVPENPDLLQPAPEELA